MSLTRHFWLSVGLVLALIGGVHAWRTRPIRLPPGVIVQDEPQQEDLDPPIDLPSIAGWQLKGLARFAMRGRVLSRERYRFDRLVSLIPVDFALGWGPMSDSSVLDQLRISQGDRFFFVHWTQPPLDPQTIMRHAANMHLIPSGATIRNAILRTRPGQIATFDGWLVEARNAAGATIRSSMSRDDTGAGACEVVLVEHFSLE